MKSSVNEQLHLEKVKIPNNIIEYMEEGTWECLDYKPFVIHIASVINKGNETLSYSLEFSPTGGFEKLNRKLEEMPYISDGYGWTQYILDKLKQDKIAFKDTIESDSESETCVLITFNENDFRTLLQKVSLYVRELLLTKISDYSEENNTKTMTISRFWSHEDEDDGICKPDIMFRRPRVDYRISEYIWSFLESKLLLPKKILQKNSMAITLFMRPINKHHKFFYDSAYNTETKKFHPAMRGSKLKDISISCSYNGFNEKMPPAEYADIVYDMYCSFLVDSFKKITKEECDELKGMLDFDVIHSFEFPATFDNQKYSGDGGGYGGRTVNWIVDEKAIPYNYRETYINQFGEL
ncbi:hypothetical protein [Paenibacillus eucommiae]|uniref:Uncharacterized protein n=1 Tax=Paenibacillus eucommiae TaxID=1355755 RepID=A0ABS4IPW5_9BACL|nr:hypothetical protein [Paenibacillus eucommiae]MBP1989614.1 hypothetical protein [Paenibacillus eucommiae]